MQPNPQATTMNTMSWTVEPGQGNVTLAAFLRPRLSDYSWRQIRGLITARRVRVGGELCLDPARRLGEGESVEVHARSAPKLPQCETIVIRYADEHLVIVEKPAGMATVRHPAERAWPARRKALHPTLEDLAPQLLARQERRRQKGPPLRVVHRLDKETSGLVVFARTVAAERGLGKQFHAHTVVRRYLAIIPGWIPPQRIATRLVRDRGDGRRGSTTRQGMGKEAITTIETVDRLDGYALISCRLETGRTHQIRIHLAEFGHPLCGEKVYNRDRDGRVALDKSGAPRLALHAAELGFVHPITKQDMHWEMALPDDLRVFVERLRGGGG
jgi:23S rRNA pseudouridine1911/1915/1917 synthase